MAQEKFSEMSAAELAKAEKSAKSGIIIMGACIVLMLAAGIYKSVTRNTFSINLVTPVIFLALLLPGIQNLKKIKAALQQRREADKQQP